MTTASQPSTGPETPPILSVILPNYNHAGLLTRAIRSLLDQEVRADEIIVIDDCSTDNSREVIERLAGSDPSIRVIHNVTNLGTLRSLQRGLEEAAGRYVYFAAADDYVLPGFFRTALEMLRGHPQTGLFCADAVLYDGNDGRFLGFRPIVRPLRKAGVLSAAEVTERLRRADNFILTGSSLFRRDHVLEWDGFDLGEGSFADGLLARRVALTHGLCYAPVIGAAWNIFSEGLSRKTALDRKNAMDALQSVPDRLAADPTFPAWYAETFRRRWRFASARLALEGAMPDRDLILRIAAPTVIDAAILRTLLALAATRAGRLFVIAWLTLRFRPYRLGDVLRTAIDRRAMPVPAMIPAE